MIKCLENLVTLYRTLITLCGILIVVGTTYHPAILGMPTVAESKALGDKFDFFGLKFPVTGICNIGSILVSGSFLLVWVELSIITKDPNVSQADRPRN